MNIILLKFFDKYNYKYILHPLLDKYLHKFIRFTKNTIIQTDICKYKYEYKYHHIKNLNKYICLWV